MEEDGGLLLAGPATAGAGTGGSSKPWMTEAQLERLRKKRKRQRVNAKGKKQAVPKAGADGGTDGSTTAVATPAAAGDGQQLGGPSAGGAGRQPPGTFHHGTQQGAALPAQGSSWRSPPWKAPPPQAGNGHKGEKGKSKTKGKSKGSKGTYKGCKASGGTGAGAPQWTY